ncbi:MAG: hypothetical protein HYZ58_05525, partial [Acidobacteria bacterium]|nr:hypothetical protein [Acidobacteriota bacterium]
MRFLRPELAWWLLAALAASAVVGRRRAHLAKAPRRSARTVRQAERASVEAVRA